MITIKIVDTVLDEYSAWLATKPAVLTPMDEIAHEEKKKDFHVRIQKAHAEFQRAQ